MLSNNAIPSGRIDPPQQALAGLRGSAAQRKSADVRVRVLMSRVKIHSIQLNPSFASATASIFYEGRYLGL